MEVRCRLMDRGRFAFGNDAAAGPGSSLSVSPLEFLEIEARGRRGAMKSVLRQGQRHSFFLNPIDRLSNIILP